MSARNAINRRKLKVSLQNLQAKQSDKDENLIVFYKRSHLQKSDGKFINKVAEQTYGLFLKSYMASLLSVCSNYSEARFSRTIQANTSKSNSSDPPDAIQHLHNRQFMLQVVVDLNLNSCKVVKTLNLLIL